MKASEAEIGMMCTSINTLTVKDGYKIIKKNKTTCWVQFYECGEIPGMIYKNIRYSILTKKDERLDRRKT